MHTKITRTENSRWENDTMPAKKQNLLRAVCLAAGAVLMFLGIRSGEPAVVAQKAVKICLECIGIG